jgi:Asp-tRNA(Asn)/Glu-tRNA(Gln) amidotransferase A subunit family amidase
LPVGVQLIARYGADAEALAAARFVEQALKQN